MGGNDGVEALGCGDAEMLVGATGQDNLTGGAANDRHRFRTLADSTTDVIVDFNRTTKFDRIELNLIDPHATLPGDQALMYRGTAFIGAARICACSRPAGISVSRAPT